MVGRVGQTPLVKVEGVFAKLECTNPCGSIKLNHCEPGRCAFEHESLVSPDALLAR